MDRNLKGRHACEGFSLVELSVVLIILGLLAGGILYGRNLIHNAEQLSIIKDFQRYRTAMQNFWDQYGALPGDMPNATDIWGIAGGSTGDNSTCWNTDSLTLSNARRTCNGDGNFFISGTGTSSDQWYAYERFRFWQHLSNAGFVEGLFSGKTDSGTSYFRVTPGKNAPLTDINNTTFTISAMPVTQYSNIANIYVMNAFQYGNYLEFRGATGSEPPLSPMDAEAMDRKMDDGSPVSGKFIAPKSTYATYAGCTTTDDISSRYNIEEAGKRCLVSFFVMP